MNLRLLGAAGACVLLVLPGCSTGGDAGDPKDPAETGPNAKGPPTTVRPVVADPRATVPAQAAVSLNRLDDKYMVAEVTLTSPRATSPWDNNISGFTSLPSASGAYPQDDLSGVYWIGPEGRSAHMTYFNQERACLCSSFDDTQKWGPVKGAPVKAALVLPAPKSGVKSVTLVSPFSLPFVNVPIGDKPPDLNAYGIPHPDRAGGYAPEVWPLVGPSTTPDGSENVSEDADTTTVELATDVLFELNKASLTAKAGKALDRTAARLDAGTATKVGIAGHTDSSGNDAINLPLSRRRAEAVKNALAQRVKAAIEFTTQGHGSSKPVADNSSPDGAARNRRVSVSIPRADDTAGGARRTGGAPAAPASGKGRPMSQFSATATDPEAPADKAGLKGLGLQRIAPGTVLLSYQMTNLRNSTEDLPPFWTAPSDTVLSSLGGTTAGDPASGRIYKTMVVDRRRAVGPAAGWAHCACSLTSAGNSFVPYGKTGTLYALLPVPETATVLDVHIGTTDDLIFRNARID